MSSRLISSSEDAVFEPMSWAIAGSAPRSSPRHSGREVAAAPAIDTARLEQEKAQARAAGRAEGEAHGRQQAMAELQPVLQKLTASIHECAELRGRLREQAEGDLVRLAMAVARKILGREITTDPEAIAGVVKVSLEKLRVQEILRIRVHPDFRSKIAEGLSRAGAPHVEVLGDAACDRGAVIFETSRGNLDASIETQLREIECGLADRL